jgi:hypothetical protein
MKTFCIVALMLFVVVGCSHYSSGRKIDSKSITAIEKGKTTRWQLLDVLGPPASVTISHDGKKLLQYAYIEVKTKAASYIPVVGLFAGGPDVSTQSLQVVCDQNDTLCANISETLSTQ